MSKQELIKKIAGSRWNDWAVEDIMNQIEAEGWLRNPGEPIDPADIREGDRVRIEYSDGEAREWAVKHDAGGDCDVYGTTGDKYFLLDRPKPELPTEPGSVVRVGDAEGGLYRTLGRDGVWRSGKFTFTAEGLIEHGFEVVA